MMEEKGPALEQRILDKKALVRTNRERRRKLKAALSERVGDNHGGAALEDLEEYKQLRQLEAESSELCWDSDSSGDAPPAS